MNWSRNFSPSNEQTQSHMHHNLMGHNNYEIWHARVPNLSRSLVRSPLVTCHSLRSDNWGAVSRLHLSVPPFSPLHGRMLRTSALPLPSFPLSKAQTRPFYAPPPHRGHNRLRCRR